MCIPLHYLDKIWNLSIAYRWRRILSHHFIFKTLPSRTKNLPFIPNVNLNKSMPPTSPKKNSKWIKYLRVEASCRWSNRITLLLAPHTWSKDNGNREEQTLNWCYRELEQTKQSNDWKKVLAQLAKGQKKLRIRSYFHHVTNRRGSFSSSVPLLQT